MAQKMMERMPDGVEDGIEKISATEELCVEHAMLDRIMLAMDRTLKMAGTGGKADLSPISKACTMLNQVVDQHHMKLEEDEIYPKFRKGELSSFVGELERQHDEARKLVARMEELSKGGKKKADLEELRSTFMDFHDMMMAHAAWEQTVLFPVMEGKMSDKELDDLKETQEAHEKELLGEDATEKVYNMLADLESSAGIAGLRDFTR